MNIAHFLTTTFKAQSVSKTASIQSLWSGYGEIARYEIAQQSARQSLIVKHIAPPGASSAENQHPYHWQSDHAHLRKLQSYEVERCWYAQWAPQCQHLLNMPGLLAHQCDIETSERVLVLTDLDSLGFEWRRNRLTVSETAVALSWLAKFHATFATKDKAKDWPQGLWPIGTYWHLGTRGDEFDAQHDDPLKACAAFIDTSLNLCPYQTLVHGDAKVANFCFRNHIATLDDIAVLDFQYVGAGVGVKDVIYLLGSCLSESQLFGHYEQLLEGYFSALDKGLSTRWPKLEVKLLIEHWQRLTPTAWADFERFLAGWQPHHQKRNRFSEIMTNKALVQYA